MKNFIRSWPGIILTSVLGVLCVGYLFLAHENFVKFQLQREPYEFGKARVVEVRGEGPGLEFDATYEVNGQAYQATFDEVPEKLRPIIREGKVVPVTYATEDPSYAVFKPDMGGVPWLIFGLSILLVGLGITGVQMRFIQKLRS